MESLKKTCAQLACLLVCYALPGSMVAVVAAADSVSVAPATAVRQVAPTPVVDPKRSVDAAASGALRATGNQVVETAQGVPPDSTAQVPEEEEPKLCDIKTIAEVMKAYDKRLADPEQTKKYQLQLRIGGFDPKGIDGKAGSRTYAAFKRLCDDYEVEDKEYSDPGEAKQRLAATLIELLLKPKIKLNGGGCGCSRNTSKDEVYGFYPYLLGGEAPEVDFGLLDRIGLYALVLDKAGEFQNDLNWNSSNTHVSDFIHEAHRHRVKVDLTFYIEEWANWNFGDISRVAQNIEKTAAIKFPKNDSPIWHSILRLIGATSSQKVDGVNLYFDYEKGKPGSSKKLQEIVTQVSDTLEDSGFEAKLNIIIGLYSTELVKLEDLKDLENILAGDKERVGKVFIFLPGNTNQPKSARKKSAEANEALQKKIREVFPVGSRATVLRKIVPIVSPVDIDHEPLLGEYGGKSQFELDLDDFKDNFGGVGLWPLPLKSASTEEQVSKALTTQFRDTDDLNYLGEKLNQYAPQVCQFVCPNRLLVDIVLGLLVIVLMTFAVLAFFNCRLREVYKRFFLVFLAFGMLVPIVFSISLSCDPVWAKIVDAVINGFLVLILAGFVLRIIVKASRPKLP